MKLAVVLFNLGGPDSIAAVEPFLLNLFGDPAILSVPSFVRKPLAKMISARRAPKAREIYEHLGGRSPILPETEAQARALEAELRKTGADAKCFIAMRCWHPFTLEAATAVKDWQPDEIVLLPLYPQYSTTTTRSSFDEWRRCAKRLKLSIPQHEVCCYPFEQGFINALADLTRGAWEQRRPEISYRVLFSAHGLPKRMVERGDPYQWQVERCVEAIRARLNWPDLDSRICYQSRVGPLQWIGPATDEEVRQAGKDGKGLIVVPVAFVSEHSETLVELDIEYSKLAKDSRVPDYVRAPAVRTHPAFIQGLAYLATTALHAKKPVTCAPERLCPGDKVCGQSRT